MVLKEVRAGDSEAADRRMAFVADLPSLDITEDDGTGRDVDRAGAAATPSGRGTWPTSPMLRSVDVSRMCAVRKATRLRSYARRMN